MCYNGSMTTETIKRNTNEALARLTDPAPPCWCDDETGYICRACSREDDGPDALGVAKEVIATWSHDDLLDLACKVLDRLESVNMNASDKILIDILQIGVSE